MGMQQSARSRFLCAALAGVSVLGCESDDTTVNNIYTSDTTPPSVTITSPPNGATFRVNRIHTITTTATDDQLVASVSFYRDGILLTTDTSHPFTASLIPSTLGPAGTHVLTAVATDGAGHTTTSAAVTVSTVVTAAAGGAAGTVDHAVFGADDQDAGLLLPVAGGDLDGDGYEDLAMGFYQGDGPLNAGSNRGEVHVLRGGPNVTASLDLASAPASMVVYGADDNDWLGASLAIGDVTGDGLADLVIGAPNSQGQGNGGTMRGEVTVIAGTTTLPTTLNLATTAPRSVLYGTDNNDLAGLAVAIADVNGDGIGDILAGAPAADGPANGNTSMGEVYVVLGSSSLPTSATLSSAAACIIYGTAAGDAFGQTLTAADVDNDGFRDVIGGAPTSPGNGGTNRGEVEVVAGRATWPASITLSSTAPLVRIQGQDDGDSLGYALAVGDATGDGLPEVFMGAPFSAGPANGRSNAGEVVVLPGAAGRSGTIDLNAALTAVFVVYGRDSGDNLGRAVACGAVAVAGAAPELIVGAAGGDGPGNGGGATSGEVYVLNLFPFAGANVDLASATTTTVVLTIYGVDATDQLGFGVGRVDLNRDGFDDVVATANGGDGPTNGGNNRGEVLVVVR